MAVFPEVGDVFGRYRIDRVLGRGGMGVVFEATDAVLTRQVALKVLLPTLSDDAEFQARFADEADVLAKLDSLHVVQIYEHGQIDGCLYLSTQLVRGGDLSGYIHAHGPLPHEQALSVIGQVCEALADAHEIGVVHRDVKPSNVLVRRTREGLHAYLCDFGIAQGDDSHHTKTGSVIGSWLYMAPERHHGVRADERADVYSVGCLLFDVLAGSPPYTGTDIEVAMAHLGAEIPVLPDSVPQAGALNGILARAMAKDPAERFQSVGELQAALAQVSARRVKDAAPAPAVVAVPATVRRWPEPEQDPVVPATVLRRPPAPAPAVERRVGDEGARGTVPPPQGAKPAVPRKGRYRGAILVSLAMLLAVAGIVITPMLLNPEPAPSQEAATLSGPAFTIEDGPDCQLGNPMYPPEGCMYVKVSVKDFRPYSSVRCRTDKIGHKGWTIVFQADSSGYSSPQYSSEEGGRLFDSSNDRFPRGTFAANEYSGGLTCYQE